MHLRKLLTFSSFSSAFTQSFCFYLPPLNVLLYILSSCLRSRVPFMVLLSRSLFFDVPLKLWAHFTPHVWSSTRGSCSNKVSHVYLVHIKPERLIHLHTITRRCFSYCCLSAGLRSHPSTTSKRSTIKRPVRHAGSVVCGVHVLLSVPGAETGVHRALDDKRRTSRHTHTHAHTDTHRHTLTHRSRS